MIPTYKVPNVKIYRVKKDCLVYQDGNTFKKVKWSDLPFMGPEDFKEGEQRTLHIDIDEKPVPYPCVFYAIYLPNHPATWCLDLMRVLINPQEKHPAHITVRGPYSELQNFEEPLNLHVNFLDMDEFEDRNVHFVAEVPGLKRFWHKPDYPAYNPHLTIYQGKDPEIIRRIKEVIGDDYFNLKFQVKGPLQQLGGKFEPVLLVEKPIYQEHYKEWGEYLKEDIKQLAPLDSRRWDLVKKAWEWVKTYTKAFPQTDESVTTYSVLDKNLTINLKWTVLNK